MKLFIRSTGIAAVIGLLGFSSVVAHWVLNNTDLQIAVLVVGYLTIITAIFLPLIALLLIFAAYCKSVVSNIPLSQLLSGEF